MLKTLLIVIVVLVVVFFVGGLLIPSEYEVSRDVVIDASPAEVHAAVNDLSRWPEWTTWDRVHDDIVYDYTGPDSGVGQRSAWSSEETGDGWIEITASDPASGVEYDLFFADIGTVSKTGFRYTPVEGGTKVEWWMEGDAGSNPMWRWFVPFMDGLVGPDYEAGLANLKEVVESDG